MLDKIDEIDGVKWSLGMNSLIGPSFPESMIPSNVREMLESDNYEVQFVCSEYSSATLQNHSANSVKKIHLKGIEPPHMVPETTALSTELQVQMC